MLVGEGLQPSCFPWEWPWTDSNRRHPVLQAGALPTELQSRSYFTVTYP
jgi:hypothetical protein